MVQEEEATKEPDSAGVLTVQILQKLSDALSSFTVPDEVCSDLDDNNYIVKDRLSF